MKFTLSFLLLFVTAHTFAQSFDELKGNMAFYGDAVMNSAATKHRLRADTILSDQVDLFLSTPGSFDVSLESVPWISTIKDDANSFRILSWQVNVGDSSFYYRGRLQKASGEFIVLLDDRGANDLKNKELNSKNWYGARYSTMRSIESPNGLAYLLFGFNAHSKWNRQKVLDVLHFDESGDPLFGMPIFRDSSSVCGHRIVLTYSAESRVVLDYDERLAMIVHDHLIPIGGRFPGQGRTFVSDGSYEGYQQDESGFWIYRRKLFNQVSDEPLDEGKDRSEQKGKDIFGRSKQ